MNDDDTCLIKGGYVVMPRHVVTDNRNGLISNPERNLLMWIRLMADMRGVSHCTMHGLANEAFNDKVSDSYINKLLRSLKSKRYLWYQDRNGRRGTFEVHLPEWFLKDGKIKDINNLFEKESVRAKTKERVESEPKPGPASTEQSQRIIEIRESLTARFSMNKK